MDKRQLLADLLAGKISAQEFQEKANKKPGILIGLTNKSKIYQIGDKPTLDDLMDYTDPETSENRTCTHKEFLQIGNQYEDGCIAIIIAGERKPPVTREEDIVEPTEEDPSTA